MWSLYGRTVFLYKGFAAQVKMILKDFPGKAWKNIEVKGLWVSVKEVFKIIFHVSSWNKY